MPIEEPTSEINAMPASAPIWRFSLSELMFFMTVAAIDFTCWGVKLGLGAFVTILFVPAMLRTLAANRVVQREGRNPSWRDQGREFLFSIFLVLAGFAYFGVIFVGVNLVLVLLFGAPGPWLIRSQSKGTLTFIITIYYAFAFLLCMYVQFRFLKRHWPG